MSLFSTCIQHIITPVDYQPTEPEPAKQLRAPRKSKATKQGPDQECVSCGKTKPRKNFATGENGTPARTCYQCYRTGTNKRPTGPQVAQARADARYKTLLSGKNLSTTEIASKMGYAHCGTLSSLLKLEKRGLIRRTGVKERAPGVTRGRGATVWTWVE